MTDSEMWRKNPEVARRLNDERRIASGWEQAGPMGWFEKICAWTFVFCMIVVPLVAVIAFLIAELSQR